MTAFTAATAVLPPPIWPNAIRALSMDAVEKANSGHPGMPMGMADVATVLYSEFLSFDPSHPDWPNRDRFILSAGHGSMLQYALLYLTGYEDMTLDEIKCFRQLGAKTAGHPEFGHAAGIETTTGPLGQGLANSVGMALAERMLAARFGDPLVDHYTYVIAGDGCLMEGISQEAISLAGHWKLNKLIVLWDDNEISIDGPDQPYHFRRYAEALLKPAGWNVQAIDGHNHASHQQGASRARKKATSPPSSPAARRLRTAPPRKPEPPAATARRWAKTKSKARAPSSAGRMRNSRFPTTYFPHGAMSASAAAQTYADWTKNINAADEAKRNEFERLMHKELPAAWNEALQAHKKKIAETKPNEATRKSSENTLEILVPVIPEMIGGSADLTGSNNTKTKPMKAVTGSDYSGRYIYYGVREHAMGAIMNGMALHGGFIPYGGTFMVFTDYCRPAIRLSALMQQRVIYVMTHDSIGLGEDGPTHQPVEHLASLRAIPNLNVFRPCDATETAECWALALSLKDAPSILSLTRQNLPALRTEYTKDNLCARGGYVISDAKGKRRSPLSPPARKYPSLSKRKKCWRRKASRRAWCRCPAGNCSTRNRPATARKCSAKTRSKLPSRPPPVSAGNAISATMEYLSACTASAPRPRPRIYTSISALRRSMW